jgi:aspartate kinase
MADGMSPRRNRRPIVLKFGGVALDSVGQVAELVRATAAGDRAVVVVSSARSGVTDRIESILRTPTARRAHARELATIAERHPDLAPSGTWQLTRLSQLVRAMEGLGSVDPPTADRIRSMGERLAVHWLSERLRSEGMAAEPIHADRLGLLTDNLYGSATILLERSRRGVGGVVRRLLTRGSLPVITGYFGRSLEGRVGVLGRGGSDYSATALGNIIGAERVDLVKPGVSVRSADPEIVPRTRPISRLSYGEAEELAQFGAKVLHPLSIEPARRAGLAVRVVAFGDSGAITTIGPSGGGSGARVVASMSPLRWVRVRVTGGRHRPGALADVTSRLAAGGVPVVAVFTRATRLSLLVPPASFRATRATLGSHEIGPGRSPGQSARVALVGAVGDGILRDLPRVSPRVLARAQEFGATVRSLSLAVADADELSTVRALHSVLVETGPEP